MCMHVQFNEVCITVNLLLGMQAGALHGFCWNGNV